MQTGRSKLQATLAVVTSAAALVAATLAPSLALAEGEPDTEAAEPTYSHKGQFGVHLQPGTGYRVLFPYNEEYCGQTSDEGPKSVCTGRSPFYLDVGLSFGVTHSLELIADLRLGLEQDFESLAGGAGPKQLSFAAGLRLFVDPDGKFKFFSTLQGVVETTDYSATTGGAGGPPLEDVADFGVRNVNGVQLDLHRTFGVFVHFGETVTFANWLRFELHGGVGVQARFP